MLTAVTLCIASCDQPQIRKAQPVVVRPESELDKHNRRVTEKEIHLEERRMQIPAIVAAFAKRTDLQRARWLAALCYLKTLDTPFMPMDIAEIALAETGSHGLSPERYPTAGRWGYGN